MSGGMPGCLHKDQDRVQSGQLISAGSELDGVGGTVKLRSDEVFCVCSVPVSLCHCKDIEGVLSFHFSDDVEEIIRKVWWELVGYSRDIYQLIN